MGLVVWAERRTVFMGLVVWAERWTVCSWGWWYGLRDGLCVGGIG